MSPVGAGPFQVVSNLPSQKLVLKGFPKYWQHGKPDLDSLTFLSVANETTAYDALQTGQAQAVTNFASYQTLAQARKNRALKLVTIPGLHTFVVQLNTTIPPFNNKLAREALYYATNANAYLHVIGGDQGTLSESPAGPGGLFFEKAVPGYRTYNLKKAKQLVMQLGGLSFTYGVGNTAQAETQGEALQSMWKAAGMQVKLDLETFGDIVAGYKNNSWQASYEAGGSFDPSIGTSGLSVRFTSKGFLSGVKNNPALDALISKAIQVAKPQKRKLIYDQIFKVIAEEAYGPSLYAPSGSFVMSKSVAGVHPVTMASFGPLIEWHDVGLAE
jgi:ABC-type transport system substrate-binding protein